MMGLGCAILSRKMPSLLAYARLRYRPMNILRNDLIRLHAMAQPRPVSIPDIVSNMAGKEPIQKLLNSADTTCHMASQPRKPLIVEMLKNIAPS